MAPDYIAMVEETALDGHRRYGHALRELVERSRPGLSQAVSDDAFSEPLAFAALSSGLASNWLDQVLCGYRRGGPDLHGVKLRPGPPGLVYVPAVGTWAVPETTTAVEARWSGEDQRFGLYAERGQLDVAFRPILRLGPAGTELMDGGHPLLDGFYLDDERPQFAGLVEGRGDQLIHALVAVSEVAPRYAYPLFALTRKVVLHHGKRPESFATPEAHGAVCLNLAPGDDEICLIEDLVHQGGHVLFSAASFDRERWFRVDRDTPLGTLTGNGEDRCSLYDALHGVFTKTAMVDVLDASYELRDLSARQRHELTGRLGFALRRLGSDLQKLAATPALDGEGRALLRASLRVWREVTARRPELLNARFANPDRRFDYKHFAALNPPPVATSA